MIDDLVSLRTKFEEIKKLNWVETKRDGTSGIGYTFEQLLGKEEEQFPIPDYGTIEIKTRYRNSIENIGLFTAAPDGDYLFSTKKMYDEYGFPDSKNHDWKVFYARIGSKFRYAGRNNQFKLYVDKEHKQIRIITVNRIGEILDTEVSWTFDILKRKIENKLKYLAVIKADSKFINGKQYFKYYSITFFMIKSFDTFVNLIEKDIINVTFMVGVYRTGPKKGSMYNHGVRVDISENDLDKLFIKVC